MIAKLILIGALLTPVCAACSESPRRNGDWLELPAATLEDKIRGGLLGQLLGNLNGLKYEARFVDQPGDISEYAPSLPRGARTDDDTDIEWVYIVEMQRSGVLFLPAARIAELWQAHINQRIWNANQYARQLIAIGVQPPLTGSSILNPWGDFNIAGQFLCESFALMAPAMPQTASRLALHYTRVAVDGEPAQTTQFFATMISTAFVTDRLPEILDAGVAAVDPSSKIVAIVEDVRRWHHENPDEWRATRRLIRDTYSRHGGTVRDGNGYELNTACTIAALLYGGGDFQKTVMTAYNLGWDCDNNAAMAATIMGVIRGFDWMRGQGWEIVDRYRNTTRDGMPEDETITGFADRIVDLAHRVVLERGGDAVDRAEGAIYRIRRERPAAVQPLVSPTEEARRLRRTMEPEIRRDLVSQDPLARARAAYLAICLDLVGKFQDDLPGPWARGVEDLNRQSKLLQVLFHYSPTPLGELLRERARAAGVQRPAEVEPIWTIDLGPRGDETAAQDTPLCVRLPELGRAAQDGFREADIDALIDSGYWLDRGVAEFAQRCDELDRVCNSIGSRIDRRDWKKAEVETRSLARLVTVLQTGDGDRPVANDPLCSPLSRDVSALEAAVERRDAELAASRWQELHATIQQLHDVVDGATSGAEALHDGLALGSRQRVSEGVRTLQQVLDLPRDDGTAVRRQR